MGGRLESVVYFRYAVDQMLTGVSTRRLWRRREPVGRASGPGRRTSKPGAAV